MSQVRSKTRVALIKEQLGRGGGLEKYAHRLIDAFQAKGCDITLLTSEPGYTQPGLETVSLCRRAPIGFWNLQRFDAACQNWLQSHCYDVVFGMDRTTRHTDYRAGNGVHAAYLRRRAGEAHWLRRLSFSLNPLHRTILAHERAAFENPELRHLFVNSQMVQGEVLSHYNIDPKKVVVVHNGVEWHEWQQPFDTWPSVRTNIYKTLGLDPNRFQLLFVGHGFERKGLGHLLRGLAQLPQDAIQLSVVGKDKHAATFAELAEQLDLKVNFFGPQSDIVNFYQVADALVIPSTYDPFANVTLEALAMGLFVISSEHNGGKEILQPFSGTLIKNIQDPDSVAEALSIGLSRPKALAQSQNIRESVRAFDFSLQLARIINLSLSPEQY